MTSDISETIVIKGSGFGNVSPQTVQVGDGSVDTYGCNVNTPFIAIGDNVQLGGIGPESWEAGLQTCNNFDLVGIYLANWNDTTVIINGFGSYLGNATHQSRWNIANGDPIVIHITGPNNSGSVLYNLVVGASNTGPTVEGQPYFTDVNGNIVDKPLLDEQYNVTVVIRNPDTISHIYNISIVQDSASPIVGAPNWPLWESYIGLPSQWDANPSCEGSPANFVGKLCGTFPKHVTVGPMSTAPVTFSFTNHWDWIPPFDLKVIVGELLQTLVLAKTPGKLFSITFGDLIGVLGNSYFILNEQFHFNVLSNQSSVASFSQEFGAAEQTAGLCRCNRGLNACWSLDGGMHYRGRLCRSSSSSSGSYPLTVLRIHSGK